MDVAAAPPVAGTSRTFSPVAAFVWLMWGSLVALLVVFALRDTFNLPLAEDWHLVRPLAGHEPDLWTWLWAQNNEHRLPLPKLVLVIALGATRDFRAGMFVNIALMAAVAAAMLRVLGAMRGGRLRVTDAFVPVALLHIGNWENFMWSWQLCFVLSSALTIALLAVSLQRRPWTSIPTAATIGALLAAIPLCGANGLAFTAPVAAWFVLEAVHAYRAGGVRRINGGLVLAGAATALAVAAYYFVGYTPATWNPPSPGPLATIKTALKFVVLGLGPAMLRTGGVGGILVALVIAPSIAVALRACVVRRRIASAARPAVPSALPNSPSADRSGAISADAAKEDRVRAARLLAFFAGGATLALAFGWGRAGLVPTVGLPDRYVLLSAPLLVWAYVVAELYAGTAMRRGVQASLFVLAIVLLPPNTNRGLEWRQWYRTGMQSVVSDIEAGQPRRVLVERHGGFLMRWSPEKLAEGMDLLQRAHIGPFADMRPTP